MLKQTARTIILCIIPLLLISSLSAQIAVETTASWFANYAYLYMRSAATADIDQDGYLDLLVSNGATGSWNIYFYKNINGELDRTPFWNGSYFNNYGSGFGNEIAVGDIDNDGYPDVALSAATAGRKAKVLLNDGGALSTAGVWSNTDNGNTNCVVLIADYNHDSWLDLFVGGGVYDTAGRRYCRIYANNAGTLNNVASWTGACGRTMCAAFGKIGTDDYLDLVVGDRDGYIRVYNSTNTAMGIQKVTSWSLFIGMNIQTVAVGDWDNDGYRDLAVGGGFGIKVFTNARTTKAAFGPNPPWEQFCGDVRSLSWGDVDLDNQLDLLAGREDSSPIIYTNTGTGLAPSIAWTGNEMTEPRRMLLADLNNDRDLEVISAANYNGLTKVYDNKASVIKNKRSWQSDLVDYVYKGINIDDVNGDKRPDLIIGNNSTAWPDRGWYNLNGTNFNPTWSWRAANNTTRTLSRGIALGDANNDGDLDLAVCTYNGRVLLYTNRGNGLVTNFSWTSKTQAQFNNITWADIDGNGYNDIVAIASAGSGLFWFRNNSGIIESNSTASCLLSTGYDLDICDIDNDNDIDVITGSSTPRVYGTVSGQLQSAAVWSAGDGTGAYPYSVKAADVDQDGYVDLIKGANDDVIRLYRNMNGVLEYMSTWSSGFAEATYGLDTGDIDGDGYYDLAVANYSDPGRGVRLYKNIAGSFENYPSFSIPGGTTGSVKFADVDSDGDFDLVTGQGSGELSGLYKNYYFNVPINLPNNPPYITRVTNRNLGNNQIQFRYHSHDSEWDYSRMRVQYSVMGQGQWKECTFTGWDANGAFNNVRCSPTGDPHYFTWNARTDGVTAPYVLVRFMIYPKFGRGWGWSESAGPIMYSATVYQKQVRITIDGKPTARIIYPYTNESFARGQSIPVIGAAYDNNFQQYTIEWRTNVSAWHLTNTSATPVTPYGQMFSWNTAVRNEGKYYLRLIARDTAGQTATNMISIRLKNVSGSRPTVSRIYPAGNATEVALNTPILAQFSNYMNETGVQSETMQVFDGNGYIEGSVDYNYFTKTLIFTPSQLLSPNTYYQVTVSSNFQNIYGESMGVNFTWGFRTDSEFSSFITQVSPVRGKTDVDKNTSSLLVRYNKNVPSSWADRLNLVRFDASTLVAGTAGWNTNNTSLNNLILRSNTLYIARVTNMGASTYGTGVPADYEWFFITRDTLIPQVLTNIPAPSSQLPLYGTIAAVFNKRMNDSSFLTNTFYILCTNTGRKLTGTREYNISRNMIRFIPNTGSLTQGRAYRVYLTTGVKDFGGLPLARTTNWLLYTPPPLARPAPVFPTNNSTNSILKNLTVTAVFASDIDAITLNAASFYVKSPASPTNSGISGTLILSNLRKVKFTPDGYLSQNTWYTGIVTARLKATNGTYLTNTYKWKFRTLPGITTNQLVFSPGKNDTNISLVPTITATFPTNIETGTVHSRSFYAFYVAGSATNIVPADIYTSGGTNAVISVQSLLPQNTLIYSVVTTNVKTASGRSLARNFQWTFRTLKPLPGTAIEYPVNASSNVGILTTVEAEFATNLNTTTVNDLTFYLVKGTNRIAGTRTFGNASKRLIFTPAVALSPNSVYTAFCTTNIKTVLGTSLLSNKRWYFKTVPPLAAPTNISPLFNATNIALSGLQVRAIFRTNINSGTVNPSTYYVRHSSGVVISGNYSIAGRSIQFVPDEALAQNTWYTAVITSGLKSTNSTSLTNNYKWKFKTVPPLGSPTNITPLANSTNNSLTGLQVRAIFRTNINSGTVNPSTFYVQPQAGAIVSGNYSVAGRTVQFVPENALSQNTWYTGVITTGLKSTNGSSMTAGYKWRFKTVPPLSSPTNILPGANTTNIALTGIQVRAVYRTNINSGTVTPSTFYVRPSTGANISGNYSVAGKTIQFVPDSYLSQNTHYTAVITSELKSTNGASMTADYKWQFKTKPPLDNPTNVSPAASTTNIPLSGITVQAVFRTNMNVSSLNSSTFRIISEAGSIVPGSYQALGKAIRFIPSVVLSHNTSYTSIISTNIMSTNFTSLVADYKWRFKTMPHIPESAVRQLNPAPETTNAGVGIYPSIAFSNSYPLNPATVNLLTVKMTNLTTPKTVFGSVSFDIGQNRITFTTSSTLDQGNWYKVIITTNVRTTSGTSLLTNFSWRFKTTAPYPYDIVLYSPTNTSTNVPLNTVISVTFFTDVDSTTVSGSSFFIQDTNDNYVGGTRATAGKVVTFTPAGGSFAQDMLYTVTIPNKAIKYTNGIYVVAGKTWTFRTMPPIGAPSEIYPAGGQKNIPISIEIYAAFTAGLDPATCTKDNFRLLKGDLPINGDVTYSPAEQKIKFQPKTALDPESVYTAILTKNLKTTAGVSMTSDYQWSFETGKILGKAGGRISASDGNLDLVVPLHALSENNVLTIEPLTCSAMTNPGANLRSLCIGYEIGPADYKLKKPVTIRINYSSTDLSVYNESKLAVYWWDGSLWARIGGTKDKQQHTISLTSSRLGRFALFEDSNAYAEEFTLEKIELQPRVFSPKNFDSAVISFELKKSVTYTVRIYDMSERLVRVLCENKEGIWGNNSESWDGRDSNNRLVPDGMYIISIEIRDGGNKLLKVKPMVLMNK